MAADVPPAQAEGSPRPIRVAHVITDLEMGGAEMALLRLVEGLEPERFVSLVVSLTAGGTIAPRLAVAGAEVLSLGMPMGRPSVRGLARLAGALRRFSPDVIQGWMYHGNLAAWAAGRLAARRAPVVWNVRQSLVSLANEKRTTRAVIRANALLSGRVACIVNNSAASIAQHEAIGFTRGKQRLISNGFDTRRFAPSEAARAALRAELGVPQGALLVGMVARWHPVKRYDLLLAAAGRVVGAGRDAHFVLVGPGITPENAELARLAGATPLGARLHLRGEVQDASAILPGLDVLVSASGWAEGFPNVVGEAMACGVPCVVTDTGDCAAIVEGCGVVVAPGDGEALGAGMAQLLALPREDRCALGAAARRRIVERYELSAAVARYAELYDRLVRGALPVGAGARLASG